MNIADETLAYPSAQCKGHLSAVEDALYVIGGKWKLKIMTAVLSGHIRFNELQRTILGISARVLSNELKQLELNGLVERVVQAEKTPVIIEYRPTAYAASLGEVLVALSNWGTNHKQKIKTKA